MSHVLDALSPCLFVHSFWRTGSTALFSALRTHPDLLCYYEPLHEGLSRLTPAKTRDYDSLSVQAAGHFTLTAPYFAEYAPLIAGRRGVDRFPAALSYGEFFNMTEEGEAALKRYFLTLARHAWSQGRLPVFCLNRSWGRMASFVRIAPEAHHVFSLREARLTHRSILDKKSYFAARLLQIGDLARPDTFQAAYPALAPRLAKRLRPNHFYKKTAQHLDDAALAPLVTQAHRIAMLNGLAHASHVIDLSQRGPFRDDRLALSEVLTNELGNRHADELKTSLLSLAGLNPHAATKRQPPLVPPSQTERHFIDSLLGEQIAPLVVGGDRQKGKLGPEVRRDWGCLVSSLHPRSTQVTTQVTAPVSKALAAD